MTEPESKMDKAAARADVYELVSVARTHPGQASAVDAALAQLVPRLASKKKYHDLSYILTLPEYKAPWKAVDAAIEALVAGGVKANQAVTSVALGGSYATKDRVAQVLERAGDEDRAAQIREELGMLVASHHGPSAGSASSESPRVRESRAFGLFEIGLLMTLSVGLVLAGLAVLLDHASWGLLLVLLGICSVLSSIWLHKTEKGAGARHLSAQGALAARFGASVLLVTAAVITFFGIRTFAEGVTSNRASRQLTMTS